MRTPSHQTDDCYSMTAMALDVDGGIERYILYPLYLHANLYDAAKVIFMYVSETELYVCMILAMSCPRQMGFRLTIVGGYKFRSETFFVSQLTVLRTRTNAQAARPVDISNLLVLLLCPRDSPHKNVEAQQLKLGRRMACKVPDRMLIGQCS